VALLLTQSLVLIRLNIVFPKVTCPVKDEIQNSCMEAQKKKLSAKSQCKCCLERGVSVFVLARLCMCCPINVGLISS